MHRYTHVQLHLPVACTNENIAFYSVNVDSGSVYRGDLVAACFGMCIAHTKQNRLIKQSAYGKCCGHSIVMLPVGILCCQMNLSASCTKLSTFLPLKCTLVHRSFRNKGASPFSACSQK